MMLTSLSARYKMFQYVQQRLRLHAASVKWHDQLLLAAVLVEYEQHVAVCSSSDQPEIKHVFGRHDPSSIPTVRSHMDSGWKTSGDNAFICEGFKNQTFNLATNMRWCPILHKNSGLNTVTFLQGKNHMVHKDVTVTCRRHGTLDRFPWCNPFKEKRAKNKGACESTPHGHVCRTQWPLIHYKRFSWTPYSTVLRIHCTFQCKVCLVSPQNTLWPHIIHFLLCQKLKGKIKTLLRIMGFQLLHNLNLVAGTSVKCTAEFF